MNRIIYNETWEARTKDNNYYTIIHVRYEEKEILNGRLEIARKSIADMHNVKLIKMLDRQKETRF